MDTKQLCRLITATAGGTETSTVTVDPNDPAALHAALGDALDRATAAGEKTVTLTIDGPHGPELLAAAVWSVERNRHSRFVREPQGVGCGA